MTQGGSSSPNVTDNPVIRKDIIADNTKSRSPRTKTNTRKRNRVPISCTICRRRKVKCDKGKPTCSNCKKNSVSHLCFYLQPSWAKELEDDELKFPVGPKEKEKEKEKVNRVDSDNNSDTDSINKDEEIILLRQKIKDLEDIIKSNNNNRDNSNKSIKNESESTIVSGSTCSKNQNFETKDSISNPYNAELEQIDLIKNFNILYTTKRSNKHSFPIIYQISVMSWLFIIKNDSYLNDLWIKIFNLRKYYEHQYGSSETTETSEKLLELSRQSNILIKSIKEKSSGNNFSTGSNVNTEIDYTNFDFNKNILTSSTLEDKNKFKQDKQRVEEICPLNHTKGNGSNIGNQQYTYKINKSENSDKLPETRDDSVCPVQHINRENLNKGTENIKLERSNSKPLEFKKVVKEDQHPLPQSVLQCPMIRHDGGLKQLVDKRCPMLASDFEKLADDEDNDDSKVCPLMLGDAKTVFRQRLLKNSLRRMSSNMENMPQNSNNGCPVVGCDSNKNKKKRKLNSTSKNVKSPGASIDIKSINFTDTRQTVSIIEKNLPNKKIVWLLLNRFFEKLYIHLPIIDEFAFRERITHLIGGLDDDSVTQRIKLADTISYEYNEEFMNICLLIVILRLSWLSLPNNVPRKFDQQSAHHQELTQEERILIKPENTIPIILVDLVKEVFSNIKILSKPAIIILQCGIFLKYYNIFSPEDGFELDDSYNGGNHTNTNISGEPETLNLNSSIYLNNLISLAKTIGLNRDPSMFKNFQNSDDDDDSTKVKLFRKRHLWRKLWYSLINLHVITDISAGDYSKHLNINIYDNRFKDSHCSCNEYWDCKQPGDVEFDMISKSFTGETDHDELSYARELKVVENFKAEYQVNVLIFKSMKILLDSNISSMKSSIDDILNEFTKIVHDQKIEDKNQMSSLGNNSLRFSQLLIKYDKDKESLLDASLRIYRFRTFLLIKMLLFIFNYILFLNYEVKLKRLLKEHHLDLKKAMEIPKYVANLDPQLAAAIEGLKKIVDRYFEKTLLLAIDNYNIFIQFFNNCNIFFPDLGAELLVYPFLMILNHRSMQFIISLVLRLQQNDAIVSQILITNGINKEELLMKLFNFLKVFLNKLDKLSKYYYYAWRLKKLIKFFYNVLVSSSKIFTTSYTKMIGNNKNGTSLDCPVLKDIKTTTAVPILPNQRQEALLQQKEKVEEAQHKKQQEVLELKQRQQQQDQLLFDFSAGNNNFNSSIFNSNIDITNESANADSLKNNFSNNEGKNENNLDNNCIDYGPKNDDGHMSGSFLHQPPTEFANQIFNGGDSLSSSNLINNNNITRDPFADDVQLDIFDDLMIDNIYSSAIDDSGTNGTSMPYDIFGYDGISNINGQSSRYTVNEVDFTNVDLSTLPDFTQFQQQAHNSQKNGGTISAISGENWGPGF
ncbi:hypothetical protein PACTADRAFT_64824 [Pachysolen tannophilus NRRL Y-2460]|uniref:Zn(2)-C6 fungal-type domain-containing protein n=1 Tax=Pachysolen tannophilus NRRL Y-2460 TaxID=669874 RepID=A0A1E4U3Q6_PACTA|nr:hypothetical protein PACTADRAFT_64824 [Pachysolen tannophilus NRRL Y-2460]